MQDDGKPVVVGWENEHPFLVRFRRTGALDRSFGGDGIVFTPTPIADYDLTGVTIQPDGRIVACGSHRVEVTRDGIGVERLLASTAGGPPKAAPRNVEPSRAYGARNAAHAWSIRVAWPAVNWNMHGSSV